MPQGFELAEIGFPDIEVVRAMAGCGMHEAGAGIIGDMIAGKQRHGEIITLAFERVAAGLDRRHIDIAKPRELLDATRP